MEFTNKKISKLQEKKRKFNYKYERYYKQMAIKYDEKKDYVRVETNRETGEVKRIKEDIIIDKITGEVKKMPLTKLTKSHFGGKAERINGCLNSWDWDMFRENKLLDLKAVVRCKDRFCPNCRKVSVAYRIIKYKKIEPELKQYDKMLLTLTQPNCKFEELEEELKKMQKAFVKFWGWLNRDNNKEKGRGFTGRLVQIKGAVRALEITYNKRCNTFHPHYHLLILIPKEQNRLEYHKKYIKGPPRNDDYVYYSDLDCQICKLWYMAYNKISLKKYYELPKYPYDQEKKLMVYYMCMTNWLNEKGVYEVFKYTFKDTDIVRFDIFEAVYFAIYKKRLIQSLGILYKVDFEEEENEIIEELSEYIKKEETSQPIKTSLKDLNTKYRKYKKISRFDLSAVMDKIED